MPKAKKKSRKRSVAAKKAAATRKRKAAKRRAAARKAARTRKRKTTRRKSRRRNPTGYTPSGRKARRTKKGRFNPSKARKGSGRKRAAQAATLTVAACARLDQAAKRFAAALRRR